MKKVTLAVSPEAMGVLMLIPPKSKKRIARIRRNLFREVESMNKELKRHKCKVKTGTEEKFITI